MSRIEARGLSYRYADGFTALDDISFCIEDGEFICIVGHSGCGKSTLLRLISGLVLPTDGQLTIDGAPITGPGLDRAVVFQQYSLFPWLTAAKNVAFGIQQAFPDLSKAEALQRAQEALKQVGMAEAADLYPYQLSGGMKQRVAIARAFSLDSDTLLLDEPFGALDQQRRTRLQQVLLDLWSSGQRRKTVVFVTHDIDEALLLADRVFFMRPGKIAAIIEVASHEARDGRLSMEHARFAECRCELLRLFALDADTKEEAL